MSSMSGEFNTDPNDRVKTGQTYFVRDAEKFNRFFRENPFETNQEVKAIRNQKGILCFVIAEEINKSFIQEFEIGGLALNKSVAELGLSKTLEAEVAAPEADNKQTLGTHKPTPSRPSDDDIRSAIRKAIKEDQTNAKADMTDASGSENTSPTEIAEQESALKQSFRGGAENKPSLAKRVIRALGLGAKGMDGPG